MPIDRIKLPDNTVEPLRDNTKQDILVSGENIKTINGESILGSGNITIEGGGGGDMSAYEVKANKVTTISASSTNEQYPSAKAVYDAIMAGGTVEEDIPDVIFIDYDGSVTNSYSRGDFAFLTEMPANPTHEGLTSQGWNWTLADAKDYVSKYGRLVIGQMYVTSDGKTRFGITIDESTLNTVSFGLTGRGTVEIDWGDGNTETTTPGTHTHTYTSAGDYVISFSRDTAGVFGGFGANSNAKRLNPAMLRWVHVGSNITEFGSDTFRNCFNVEYITIPHGVTKSVSYPFAGCNSLKALVLPDTFISSSNAAFSDCFSLKYISLGPNYIVSGAYFSNCSSLLEVNIPPGNTNIGNNVFERCTRLLYATTPEGLTAIGQYCFRFCFSLRELVLPDTLTSMGSNSIDSCFSLKRVSIPCTITAGSFSWNISLESVEASGSIGRGAFNTCVNLSKVKLNSGCESIDQDAFTQCQSLKEIVLPEGLVSIGSGAFTYCRRLERLYIPSTLQTLSANAFKECFSLREVAIDVDASFSLGDNAFLTCCNLEYFDASGATSIGANAFLNCVSLKEIKLNDQLTSILSSTFNGCVMLTHIDIPASVTNIGASAFNLCTALRDMYVHATTPPTAGSNFLGSTPDGLTIHVPAGTLSAYQSATNWSAYASKMVEMDE